MSIKLNSLAVGMATYVPGLRHLTGRKTGNSVSARYCYSVSATSSFNAARKRPANGVRDNS